MIGSIPISIDSDPKTAHLMILVALVIMIVWAIGSRHQQGFVAKMH
jgi:uncharacterized membrane protein